MSVKDIFEKVTTCLKYLFKQNVLYMDDKLNKSKKDFRLEIFLRKVGIYLKSLIQKIYIYFFILWLKVCFKKASLRNKFIPK